MIHMGSHVGCQGTSECCRNQSERGVNCSVRRAGHRPRWCREKPNRTDICGLFLSKLVFKHTGQVKDASLRFPSFLSPSLRLQLGQ